MVKLEEKGKNRASGEESKEGRGLLEAQCRGVEGCLKKVYYAEK